jgi:histidinol-phosphatase
VSDDRDPSHLLRAANEWLDETDRIALTHFAGELTITAKHDRTLVTQADTEIETRLRERIGQAYPAHRVLGEEFGSADDAGHGRWIIDPIDATHNFVRGIEVFATLLAFERGGELELGVVSAPAMRRRWWALRGAGAHVRDDRVERRIRVSAVETVDRAQILFSTLRGLDDAGLGDALHRLTSLAWRDRGFGDFWGHMLVAQGSAEAMLEYGIAPWDMAAPHVIISEAGGRMTDLAGRSSWSGPQILTTNGVLHDQILELLEGP